MAAQLACPSADKEGNDLVGHGSDGPDFSCVYNSTGACIYNAVVSQSYHRYL
jgi:hypothetical protein